MTWSWSGASSPGTPGRPNEDWLGATPDVVVVLDGVSAPRNDTGCRHGTPWFVRGLGSHILAQASDPEQTLPEVLGVAISAVAMRHRDTCDLAHPGTPSAAVALVRQTSHVVEYFVLADTVVLVDTAQGLTVVTDPRVEDVVQDERATALSHPIGTDAHTHALQAMIEKQRLLRNQPGGYWVAQNDPVAAEHAVTGTVPIDTVRGGAALSDGVGRLVDLFGKESWDSLYASMHRDGVVTIVEQVRELEQGDPDGLIWPRYKTSDDATAMLWTLG